MLYWMLLLLFAGVFVFSAYQLISIGMEYQRGTENYDALLQYVQEPFELSDGEEEGTDTETEPSTDRCPTIDFAGLQEMNPDIVAWIYCQGTVINYPVVQTEDNEYYLNHLFNGERNSSGCLFVDFRNGSDFSDENTIIYGHNMKNQKMFAPLVHYSDQTYYDAHPVMWLITPEKSYKLEVFSGYVTDPTDQSWQRSFTDRDTFENWLRQTEEKSMFSSNVTVDGADRVVTLSTCTYDFDDARYIVVAKLS